MYNSARMIGVTIGIIVGLIIAIFIIDAEADPRRGL